MRSKQKVGIGVALLLTGMVAVGRGQETAVRQSPAESKMQGGVEHREVLFEELTAGQDLPEWLRRYRVHRSVVRPFKGRLVRIGEMGGPVWTVVGEEGDYLIVQEPPPEDPFSPYHKLWLKGVVQEARLVATEEQLARRLYLADKPEVSPVFVHKLELRAWDKGLPKAGEWQVSGDVYDFDGDGKLDLVIPPPRGGVARPFIFRNGGDGTWSLLGGQSYPKDAPLDYGSVRVSDFNRDGRPDLILACHFKGLFVLYGSADGMGRFDRWEKVPTLVGGVTSRIVEVADFNNDRRPDVISLAEIDLNMQTQEKFRKGLVNVVLNSPEGWHPVDAAFSADLMGDGLAVGDIDGDKALDIALTSFSQNVDKVLFLNRKQGSQWELLYGDWLPFNAFVNSVALGPVLPGNKGNDLVLCFEQVNALEIEPATHSCVLYQFFKDGQFSSVPEMTVLFSEKGDFAGYRGLALGDVDGNGLLDVVVGNNLGRLRVFLQVGKGRFLENLPPAEVPGKVVSVRCVDLDHDKRAEIVVQGVPKSSTLKNGGGVWVFKTFPVHRSEGLR